MSGFSRYASGTTSAETGLALVGEEGPEFVMMHGGEAVLNAADTHSAIEAMTSTSDSSVPVQVLSPCTLTVQDGAATAAIVWSSSKYDYMLVNGERYDVLSTEPGSTFEIPVEAFDTDLTVIGDTTAMSTPHEIEYTLNFSSASLQAAGE